MRYDPVKKIMMNDAKGIPQDITVKTNKLLSDARGATFDLKKATDELVMLAMDVIDLAHKGEVDENLAKKYVTNLKTSYEHMTGKKLI